MVDEITKAIERVAEKRHARAINMGFGEAGASAIAVKYLDKMLVRWKRVPYRYEYISQLIDGYIGIIQEKIAEEEAIEALYEGSQFGHGA